MNPNNGRILKNTGLLYFRLLFLTIINLYAVRITLDALGLVDYGIFTVVASMVASLSILTGAMTSATQRFLSFHLGTKDTYKYSHTFTLFLMIFLGLAGVLILIGEIIGFFFIKDLLSIPPDRVKAAFWLFQATLVSFVFGLLTIPYTSSIVANERMDAFAIFSVVEGVLKLLIAYMLIIYGGDRLILYGILTAGISIVVFLMSMQYCHSNFKYCKYIWKWDKSIISELSKYTGWNLFGSVSGMLCTQGQNILLNIYFGPIITAAKGIADRIYGVINGLSVNLYMAASPQIIKSYAAKDYSRTLSLVVKTSKLSFLLIFVIAFPLICNMAGLLQIWLGADGRTPDTTAFSQLILVYCMVLALEPPISRLIQATGNIKRYQISVGIVTLSYIPIATLILWLGGSAIFTLVVLIAVMGVAQIIRIIVAHNQVGISYGVYLKTVILPILKISVVGVALYLVFRDYANEGDTVLTIIYTAIAGICGVFTAALLGIDSDERKAIAGYIKSKMKK